MAEFDQSRLTEHRWAELPDRARAVFARLAVLGVRVPLASRFDEHLAVAETMAAADRDQILGLPDVVARVPEAAFELRDFCASMECLLATQPSRGCLDLIRRAVGGPVLPQDEGEFSPARDAQFELSLAAMCHRARLPTEWAEPDLVVTFGHRRIGLAAKRIKSKSALEKHVRKARDQIQRAKIWGVIALDISTAAHPTNAVLHFPDRDAIERANEEFFADFEKRHGDDIRRWVAGRNVLGLVTRFRVHAYLPDLGVATYQAYHTTEIQSSGQWSDGLFSGLVDRMRLSDLDERRGGTA